MDLYRKGDSLQLLSAPNYESAAEHFAEAKDLFSRLNNALWVWQSELGLIHCEIRGKDARSGLRMSQELLAEFQEASVPDSMIAYANYLYGRACHNLGIYSDAIEFLEKSLVLFDELGIRDERHRNAIWILGYDYDEIGQSDVSSKYYTEAIVLTKSLPTTASNQETLYKLSKDLSAILQGMGNYREARRVLGYTQNYLFDRSGHTNFDETILHNGFARLYYNNFNFSLALEHAEKSLLARDNFDARHRKAITLHKLGRFEESIRIYKENIAIRKVNSDFYVEDKGRAFQGLGFLFLELGQLDSAEKCFKAAEGLYGTHPPSNRRLALTLMDFGELHTRKGRYSIAHEYLSKSNALLSSFHNHNVLQKLSFNFFHQGQMDSAVYYGEAAVLERVGFGTMEIRAGVGAGSRRDRLLLDRWLVELYDKLDFDIQFPRKSVGFASKLHQDYRPKLFQEIYPQYLVNETSFIYQEGIRNSLRLAEREDPQWAFQAFTFSEWSKVQSLQGAWRGSEARQYGDIPADLLDLENDLLVNENYARSQIQRFGSEEEADSAKLAYYDDKLFRLQHSQDSLQNVFETTYPRYHQLRYASDSVSVQDVQRRLASNEAFMEYYVGDTVSYVFLITQDQYEVKPIDLVHDSLTFELRESFKKGGQSHSIANYQDQALPIYEQYLKPAIDELGPQIDELIIVPDGNLSYFPLGALVTASTDRPQSFKDLSYLMDDYTIHYAYSASLYFNEFTSLSKNNDLLAFAPSYETTLQDTARMRGFGQFRNQITSLAHTLPEVNGISEFFSGQTFVADEASEANFKSNIGDPGILHLAMHAIVDDEEPMNSRMLFYNNEDTLEDGFLHAFEIYNMRIPSKMTVLSACETGYGKMAKGEGAMSLARAFAYAGSPSIVMSHWQVDDESTAALMTHFYRHLSEGESKGAALRKARQDFLAGADITRSHPFFWASFVVVGDDAPIKTSTTRYGVIALALVAIAGASIYARLRHLANAAS